MTATALPLIDNLGASGAMWVYVALNVVAFVFFWRLLPYLTGQGSIQRGCGSGTCAGVHRAMRADAAGAPLFQQVVIRLK